MGQIEEVYLLHANNLYVLDFLCKVARKGEEYKHDKQTNEGTIVTIR